MVPTCPFSFPLCACLSTLSLPRALSLNPAPLHFPRPFDDHPVHHAHQLSMSPEQLQQVVAYVTSGGPSVAPTPSAPAQVLFVNPRQVHRILRRREARAAYQQQLKAAPPVPKKVPWVVPRQRGSLVGVTVTGADGSPHDPAPPRPPSPPMPRGL